MTADRLAGARVEAEGGGWLVRWTRGGEARSARAATVAEAARVLYELDGRRLTDEDVLDAAQIERHARVDDKLVETLGREALEAARATAAAPAAETLAAARAEQPDPAQPHGTTAMARLRRALRTLERWHAS